MCRCNTVPGPRGQGVLDPNPPKPLDLEGQSLAEFLMTLDVPPPVWDRGQWKRDDGPRSDEKRS